MTIADTRSGKVEGVEIDGVQVFKGIPYASPPVGARRWRPPVREDAWDGVRDASQFSAQSAQGAFAMNVMFGAEQPAVSEDSLYLNVWTPACDDAKRPVMLWIHGGAFVFGSGDTPWYDGTRFAHDGDVVVVTINYRLGAFGFLHLADAFGSEFEGSGNAGILDQVAALEWVRDSIAAFGGDPANVTVFGESAGGGSVGTLLGMPAARGLFQNAIAESGASSWWATRERAAGIAVKLVSQMGVAPGDVDTLRAVPMEQIIEAGTSLGTASPSSGGLSFQPVVDGTSLPQPPLDAIDAGNADGVRVLVGTNRHEITLFNMMDPQLGDITLDRVAPLLEPWSDGRSPEIIADYESRRPGFSGLEMWTDVGTDAVFRIPAIRLAEAQLAHAPVWMYLFTWETPVFGGALRCTHALEIPFVFDNLDRGTEVFTGTGQERQQLADAMHKAWIAFARHGDPSHPGIPSWPSYAVDRRATMRFDLTPELVDDPMGADRAAWGQFRR
jgi:para-nitrobenzyl esterase